MALRHLFASCLLVLLSIVGAYGQRANLPKGAVKEKYEDVPLELYRAIENGDLAFVRKSLNADPRLATAVIVGPNKGPPILETLLHHAAWNGHPTVVEELIRRGANVNARVLERDSDNQFGRRDGETPLHKAMWRGNMQTVTLLVEHGADVNASAHSGVTPLHEAASRGRTYLVKYLLKRGADINAHTEDGTTALHLALWAGYPGSVSVLASRGAKQDIFSAAGLGNLTLIERFLQDDPDIVNARDGNRATPLHYAAATAELNAAKLLLKRGAAIGAQNGGFWYSEGETPLHVAANRGHLKMSRFLIESGADIDKYGNGRTPLHAAIAGNHLPVVEYLLGEGADIHRPNQLFGQSALHIAASWGHVELADLLIRRGAHINCRTVKPRPEFVWPNGPMESRGEPMPTPLDIAITHRHFEMAHFLQERGGRISEANHWGHAASLKSFERWKETMASK